MDFWFVFFLYLYLICPMIIHVCFSGKAAMMEPTLSLLSLVLLALCIVGFQI